MRALRITCKRKYARFSVNFAYLRTRMIGMTDCTHIASMRSGMWRTASASAVAQASGLRNMVAVGRDGLAKMSRVQTVIMAFCLLSWACLGGLACRRAAVICFGSWLPLPFPFPFPLTDLVNSAVTFDMMFAPALRTVYGFWLAG